MSTASGVAQRKERTRTQRSDSSSSSYEPRNPENHALCISRDARCGESRRRELFEASNAIDAFVFNNICMYPSRSPDLLPVSCTLCHAARCDVPWPWRFSPRDGYPQLMTGEIEGVDQGIWFGEVGRCAVTVRRAVDSGVHMCLLRRIACRLAVGRCSAAAVLSGCPSRICKSDKDKESLSFNHLLKN